MKDNGTPFTKDGDSVNVGAHICAIHEGPEGVLRILSECFQAGLELGERCVYVASEEAASEVRSLLKESGFETSEAESRGDLVFISQREALLKDGTEFDPDHAVESVKSLFGETLEAGYAGLRFSADVPWLTRGVPGEDRVMEFEAKADEIINTPGVPLLALCQYRLSDLDPEDSIEILERHPMTLVGGRVHKNEEYAFPR